MDDRPRALTIPSRTSPWATRSPQDQDSSFLHRIADGDESALTALYDQWSGRVHTIAFWILKDADEAEDVVEETFWQVSAHCGTVRPGPELRRRPGSA